MLYFNMSELTAPRPQKQSGHPLVWVLGLLSLLALSYASYSAIRHNPLYSDRDAYGISKYRFIEECKEGLHDAKALSLNFQGQEVKLSELIASSGQLHQNETLVVSSVGDPQTVVSGVQPLEAGKLGLVAPVMIAARSSDGERKLAPANMQCVHDKATGKTEVGLSLGQ